MKPKTERQRRAAHRRRELAAIAAAEAAKPKPRRNPAKEMLKGAPLEGADLDPVSSPLWFSDSELAERQQVMREVEAFEGSTAACGFQSNYVNFRGTSWPAHRFVEWQSRTAYALLNRRLNPATVARAVYRDVPWVLAEAARHGIEPNDI